MTGERAVVEVGIVGTQDSTVDVEPGGLAPQVNHGMAGGFNYEALLGFDRRVRSQKAARLQGFQIGDNQGTQARLGHVGIVILQVNMHIVEVGLARSHRFRARDDEQDLAGFGVGFHQLGAAGHGELQAERGGVENPRHPLLVGLHGLGANPVLEGLVLNRVVPHAPPGIGIRLEGVVEAYFGDGIHRIIVTTRKAGEDFAARLHSYPPPSAGQ